MLLQGSAVLSSFGALIPSKWVGGHRSDLAAIGLMAASTVSMLRNAQPPYLNDAVGALRAGSSFAAAMATASAMPKVTRNLLMDTSGATSSP